MPVLYITVSSAATPKMLAVEIARFPGLELNSRANLPEIVNAVCTTAAATRVELVPVNEIHNLTWLPVLHRGNQLATGHAMLALLARSLSAVQWSHPANYSCD